MKAMQKILHLTLILAISLASTGFRVRISDCHEGKQQTISFFGSPDCCCNKSANKSRMAGEDCGAMACVMPATVYQSFNIPDSYEQSAKFVKAAYTYAIFTDAIYPALQESQPYFTLPPPQSGRFKGILHQTFLL